MTVKQATAQGKKDVVDEEEFPVFDDLEHFTIQKKDCQKINSSKWGKIRIAILKNEEGYKMLTQSSNLGSAQHISWDSIISDNFLQVLQ